MAKTIFNATARQQLLDRLARLTPDSQRRFGKMTPHQMLCHMQDAIRCAFGEIETRPMRTPLSIPPLRWFILYVMPWPKGRVQSVKEMLQTSPTEFEADRRRLAELIVQAAERGPNATWAPHPAFGDMSGKDYGVLLYRHSDHHFQQFGV